MASRLQEAAVEGSVALLIELLQQDPLLLDRVNLNDLTETPLHVAALLGHVDFVHEILQRKPQLVKELDSQRSSPLHFAAAKGHLEIVKSLLQVDADMCFVCNEDGRNPLYLAAMKGQVDVLHELIRVRPRAARTVVDHGGTILHFCVKNNQLEALRMVIETIDDNSFLNAKDDYGFTILHLAVSNKQIETVRYLVNDAGIEVNALNSNGFTALDVLAQSHRNVKDWDIAESLRAAGALRTCTNMPPSSASVNRSRNRRTQTAGFSVSPEISHNQIISLSSNNKLPSFMYWNDSWLSRKKDALMVVASLIATMAFQAGVNPPGGVWQDDSASKNPNYRAGTSIMAAKAPGNYSRYLSLNTAGFTASLIVILMLITGLPFKHPFFLWILIATIWIAITSMGLAYGISISFFTPSNSLPVISLILSYASIVISGAVGLLLLGKIIQLFSHLLKKLNNFLWKERLPTRLNSI